MPLIIGFFSVVACLPVGTSMGMVAGFYGGKTETLIMRAVDVLMCFPDLILAISVTAVLESNLVNLIITIAIVMTPRFARLSHGQPLKMKESEYVIATQAIDAKVPRVLVRHIFPIFSVNSSLREPCGWGSTSAWKPTWRSSG